jgi:hypothetical protein
MKPGLLIHSSFSLPLLNKCPSLHPTIEYAVHEMLKKQPELMIDEISINQAKKALC